MTANRDDQTEPADRDGQTGPANWGVQIPGCQTGPLAREGGHGTMAGQSDGPARGTRQSPRAERDNLRARCTTIPVAEVEFDTRRDDTNDNGEHRMQIGVIGLGRMGANI